MARKPTRKGLEKKLDKLWSKIILAKNPVCIFPKCGRPAVNAHHIFSRRNKGTRWLPENGAALCAGHHTFSSNSAHQNPYEFYEFIKDRMGDQAFQILRMKTQTSTKFTLTDLEFIYNGLSEKQG